MKPSGMSQYQRVLLIFAVLSLLLALIGSGLAWFVLGPHVILWFRAIATELILVLSLFAFAGLATSQRMARLLGPVLGSSQESVSDIDRKVVGAMIAFIPVSLACAFIPYLSDLSNRALLKTARVLIISGLGFSMAFAVSFIYVTVDQARFRCRGW